MNSVSSLKTILTSTFLKEFEVYFVEHAKHIDKAKFLKSFEKKYIEKLNTESLDILRENFEVLEKLTRTNWAANDMRENAKSISKYLRDIRKEKKESDAFWDESSQIYSAQLKKNIKKWRRSSDEFYKYPLIRYKTKNSIEKALSLDIERKLLQSTLLDELLNAPKPEVKEALNSLVSVAVDSTNKLRLTNDDNGDFVYTYNIDGYSALKYSISKKEMDSLDGIESYKKLGLSKIKTVLNSNDMKIFEYIIANRGANFFKDGKVLLDLNLLCKELFGSERKRNKDLVLSSLFKMDKLKIWISKNNNLSNIASLSLFESYFVEEIDDGKIVGEVVISSAIRDESINTNTIKVYKEVYELCSQSEDAKRVLFYLQKDRIVDYYSNERLKEGLIETEINGERHLIRGYVKEVDMSYFASCLIFGDKKQSKVISRINNFLDLIVSSKSILIGYSRIRTTYYLEFKSLVDTELEDLNTNLPMVQNNF